jgi:hypothetical protein
MQTVHCCDFRFLCSSPRQLARFHVLASQVAGYLRMIGLGRPRRRGGKILEMLIVL